MKKTLLIAFLYFQVLVLFSQTNPAAFLTKKSAIEDIMILKSSLYEIHPSIFRYTSKDEFDRQFDMIVNSINDSLTRHEFTGLVTPIVSMVRCGHTYPLIPYIDSSTKAIPLDIKIIDNKIYVIKNLSGKETPEPGTELLQINDLSSSELLEILRNREVADGYVTTAKDRKIERFFKWYYAIYVGQPDSFKIHFNHHSNNALDSMRLASLTDNQIEQNRGALKQVKPIGFEIDMDHKVAVLRINSFMAKQIKKRNRQNLKKIVSNAFKEIKMQRIDNLIIDIRDNTGGMAFVPPFLYTYIGMKDFKFKEQLVFRHGYRFSNDEYLNRSKLNDWFNRKLMRKVNDTTYAWTLHNNTRKTYRVKKNSFKGQVYVLVNGMTASGAAEFATLVHHNKRGILVGEESGGDYNGINGYDRTYLQLPNSKIGVMIAGYRSVMPWDEIRFFGHGVPVDYTIHPDINDLVKGRDTELEFVYKLIRR
jgi:hypothetical protein